MKRIFHAWLLISLLIVSCNAEKETHREEIIPADTLVLLLADLHLADAYLSVNRLHFKADKSLLYQAIMDEYGVERARFDTSVQYYSLRGEEYEQIYEDLLVHLSQLEAELTQDHPSDSLPTDTLIIESNRQLLEEDSIANREFLDRLEEARKRKEALSTERKKTSLKAPGEE